ncbi:MAG: tetratricopeptide repeat protein [Prevotellamassilia sp.]|jgi:predicted negative regulator of RcsB-dependent stress response|nr:tetratricopeptide repeat protein [Prevotellamassilia sp.]
MSNNQNLQENQAAEVIATTGAWVDTNKKKIISIIAGVVIVVGGYLGYTYGYQQPREEKAQTLCTDGLQFIQNSDFETALNGEGTFPGYIKIADEYSGTDGANLANLYAGVCFAQQNKYQEAIPYLKAYTPGDDQSVSAMALFALAQCYAGVNDVDQAITTFQKAAEQADNSALSPMCLIEAGKLLESQNKNAEALAIYETIKRDYPTSTLVVGSPAEIEKYIERAKK